MRAWCEVIRYTPRKIFRVSHESGPFHVPPTAPGAALVVAISHNGRSTAICRAGNTFASGLGLGACLGASFNVGYQNK